MAIGLDTSVVLRLLIGEPRLQVEIARRRIERALAVAEKVVVTDLVIAETFHALRHHYGVPETVALSRLQEFLSSDVVHLDPAGAGEALGQGDMQALQTASSSPAIAPSGRPRRRSIDGRPVWREGYCCGLERGVLIVTAPRCGLSPAGASSA